MLLAAQHVPVRRGYAADAAPAAGPRTEFLREDDARRAIVDDSADGYFTRLTAVEVAAKTGKPVEADTPDGRVAEAKCRYAEAVREFTDEEREAVGWYVVQVHQTLTEHYPRLTALPWRFIKVDGALEAGMPHTRGDCIILSEPVLNHLVNVRNDRPPEVALGAGGPMLVHEQLHVLQRKDPRRFDDLYTRLWHLRRVPTIAGAEKLKDRIVANPDAPLSEWVFPVGAGKWVWPLIVFPEATDETSASLRRMEMVAARVDEGAGQEFRLRAGGDGGPDLVPLENVEEYMATFYPTRYAFHPNEAAAALLERLIVFDSPGGRGRVPPDELEKMEAALRPVRDWFREHLAND
jgi:hypothetical protein